MILFYMYVLSNGTTTAYSKLINKLIRITENKSCLWTGHRERQGILELVHISMLLHVSVGHSYPSKTDSRFPF